MAQPLPNFASFLRAPPGTDSPTAGPSSDDKGAGQDTAPQSGESTPTDRSLPTSPSPATAAVAVTPAATPTPAQGTSVPPTVAVVSPSTAPNQTTEAMTPVQALQHSRVHALRETIAGGTPAAPDALLLAPRNEFRTGDNASENGSDKADAARKRRHDAVEEPAVAVKRNTSSQYFADARKRSESFGAATPTDDKKPMVPQLPAGASATPTPPTRERTSRYLSEGDRREIISRIDRGEKQVALAKEYCVSRAAICNLYKNRQEVLTRADRDPDAKHPKKNRKKPTAVTPSPVVAAPSPKETQQIPDDTDQSGPEFRTEDDSKRKKYRFVECSSRSAAIKRLITVLRSRKTPSTDYRQTADRIARLVLEEALARLPPKLIDVKTEAGDICAGLVAPWNEDVVCALSIEQKGLVMLTQFANIHRRSPTGTVSVWTQRDPASDQIKANVQINVAPAVFKACQVFLVLDTVCANGDAACAVINELVTTHGIPASSIYFVTLITALPGLERIHQAHPDTTVISAVVDAVVDDQNSISPGIGNFAERYWNAKDSPAKTQMLTTQI